MRDLLSPKQVARAIGVSEASLKRWCDKGVLPVRRTAGGHRRLPISGVIQFLRRTGHPLVRPEILGLPSASGAGEVTFERSRGRLGQALEGGDEEQCRRIVFDLYLAGCNVCGICDQVVAPAFHDLGARWQHGDIEVYQERRGCEICMRILAELRLMLRPVAEAAPYAAGGTLGADPYTLPSMMVELCLRETGWRAESYGVGIPAGTLCAAIREREPRLFWLSVSTMDSPAEFHKEYRALYETAATCGTALVVGGRALTEEIRREMTYSAYCDNLRHLVAFADSLRASPATGGQ
jgi:methanogenic corrinoid protein MtbC1